MMVLFIGAFTGFGNTIADLTKNSEKVITVSADDVITANVVILKMVENDFVFDRRLYSFIELEYLQKNSFIELHRYSKRLKVYNKNYNQISNQISNKARDKLTC